MKGVLTIKKYTNCEKLMKDAFALLESGKSNKAIAVGKRLIKLRYSGGFEILALASYDSGRTSQAIKILERGLKIAPDVWRLWQLLGNYLSEVGRYRNSFQAFEKGLLCSNVDQVSLACNYAVALNRANKIKRSFIQNNGCYRFACVQKCEW